MGVDHMSTYPKLPTNIPPGQLLLIIGTCSGNAPANQPIYVRNSNEVESFFGPELVWAFNDAKAAGADYICIMRVGNRVDYTKNDLYILLEEAYELLYGFPCNIVYPVLAYYDNWPYDLSESERVTFMYPQELDEYELSTLAAEPSATDNSLTFPEQLARFCSKKIRIGEHCLGVIETLPINKAIGLDPDKKLDSWDIEYWVERLIDHSLLSSYDGYYLNKFIDGEESLGKYISVVASHYIDDDSVIRSAAATYAGLLASCSGGKTTTYKKSPLLNLAVELNKDQLSGLSDAGFVVFTKTIRRGIVPYRGVTYAEPASDYHDVANIRILHEACIRIQNALSSLIGNVSKSATSIATSVLNQMVREDSIVEFKVNPIWTDAHTLQLEILIRPHFHVGFISSYINVKS